MSQNVPVSNANCQTEDQANSSQQNRYTCSSCSSRTFSTCKNLNQHNRHCTNHFNVVSISSSQPVTISERTEVTNVFSPVASFVWGERDGALFRDDLNEAYEKRAFWRKKIFLNAWTQDMPLRSISLKAIHTPTILLQKSSKTSKKRPFRRPWKKTTVMRKKRN